MNHQEVSERLQPYVQGELEEQERSAVETHLAGCHECSEELVALERIARLEPPVMSEIDRARLHRAVAEATRGPGPAQTTPWFGRVAPALGAAALIALAAVVAVNVTGGDEVSEGGGSAETAADESRGNEQALKDQPDAAAAPEVEPGSEDVSGGGDEDITEDGALAPESEGRAGPVVFERFSKGVDSSLLQKLGRKTVRAALSYKSLENGTRVVRTSSLARSAPRGLREQVRRCDRAARARTKGLLATYGASGRFDSRRSLILGFIYRSSLHGGRGRFSMWAWPVGSCDRPLEIRTGKVKP